MSETVSRETVTAPTHARGCGVDWTEVEIAELIRLRRAGYQTKWIADKLVRTHSAVRLKLHRLGVKVQDHAPARSRRTDQAA